MAVRIYSLARELKLDSNVLVDICSKAGVLGKGALAGLTEDEVTRVKSFIAAGGSKAAEAAPRAAVATTVARAAEARPLRRENSLAASPSATSLASASAVRHSVASTPSPMTRPASTTLARRPPILRTASPSSSRPPVKRPIETRPPAIRLAPLPAVEQPMLTPASIDRLSGPLDPDGNASIEATRFRAGSVSDDRHRLSVEPSESPSPASDNYDDDVQMSVVRREEPDSIGNSNSRSTIPASPIVLASPIVPASTDESSPAVAAAKQSGGKPRANKKRLAPLHELLKRSTQPPNKSVNTTLSLVFAIPLAACLKVYVFNPGNSFFNFVMAGIWGAATSYLVLVLYSNWRTSVFFRQWKQEIVEVARECGVAIPELNDLIAKQYPKLSKFWNHH